MRKVKDAVDLTTNEKIYFKGHAKATYLSDGRNVEDAIQQSGGGGSYNDTAIWEAINKKQDKAVEVLIEDFGDPVVQQERDSSVTLGYSKEQIETAFGKTIDEIFQE